MMDSMKELMKMTEELVLDYVGSVDPTLKVNVTRDNRGMHMPVRLSVISQENHDSASISPSTSRMSLPLT